jgi:hypothetical protein
MFIIASFRGLGTLNHIAHGDPDQDQKESGQYGLMQIRNRSTANMDWQRNIKKIYF